MHTKYSKKTDALAGQVKAIHDERDKLQAEIDHTSTTFTAEKADLEKQIATLKPEEKQASFRIQNFLRIDILLGQCNDCLFYIFLCDLVQLNPNPQYPNTVPLGGKQNGSVLRGGRYSGGRYSEAGYRYYGVLISIQLEKISKPTRLFVTK